MQQAGRDLVNVTVRAARTETAAPGLVSVEPPQHRNTKVRGRHHLVAFLEREIRLPSGRVVVLHGGGGFGKTALAIEAARFATSWAPNVWWISGSDTARLSTGMREVALRLGIPAEEVEHAWSGRASAPDLLWRYLNRTEQDWVLFIDDVEEPQSLAAADQRLRDGTGWLRPPPVGRGTVVVTSRDGNRDVWGDFSHLRRVGPLDDASGGGVLTDLAGSGAGTEEAARRLSARLGGLPLALHIAGTYLACSARAPRLPGDTAPRTFPCYGRALEQQFARTIDRLPPGDRRPRAESQIVTRTWELSLDLLARQGYPKARALMRFLACFAQAPVLCDLVDVREMRSIPAFDTLLPEELIQLLQVLIDFGLVDSVEDRVLGAHSLVLHPLVRETNLHHLDRHEVDNHVRTLLRILETALEAADPLVPSTRRRWIAMAAHGAAPLALLTKMGAPIRPGKTLARATFLDYVTQLFLEVDRSRAYPDLFRPSRNPRR